MRFTYMLSCCCLLQCLGCFQAAEPLMPFPQADSLQYQGLKPNQHSQKELNAVVTTFYKHWKKSYLLESELVPGDYKVSYNKKKETVSEAMGYGMLLVVQMAGYDTQAQAYFDGLNRFRKRYPSKVNKAFMCWKVREKKPRADDCATDGDIDMATALLMAAQQWDDEKYLEEAKVLIENMAADLLREDFSLRLGDWNADDGTHAGTRPSDFATAHFRVFFEATGDERWKKAEEKCYTVLEQLQRDCAPKTGLIPDFAVGDAAGHWRAASQNFLEGKHDGDYSYNSCRVPWRIGLSALYHGEPRARKIVNRLTTWLAETKVAPADFKAGYDLSGKPLVRYTEPVFTAPLAVATMLMNDQAYLNAAFDCVKEEQVDYFSDSVNLLSLLVLTGNYWLPCSD